MKNRHMIWKVYSLWKLTFKKEKGKKQSEGEGKKGSRLESIHTNSKFLDLFSHVMIVVTIDRGVQ